MGYNTNITICNDNLSDYARNPTRFVDIIQRNIQKGGEAWDMTVHRSEHADSTQLIAVGGNFSTKLYVTSHGLPSHHTKEGEIALLKDWAAWLGFEVVKK